MDSELGTTDSAGAPEDGSRAETVAPPEQDRNLPSTEQTVETRDYSDYSDYSDTESELSFSDCVYLPDELEALQKQLDEECIVAIECPEETKEAKQFVEDEPMPDPPTSGPAAAPVAPAGPVVPARGDVDSDDDDQQRLCRWVSWGHVGFL